MNRVLHHLIDDVSWLFLLFLALYTKAVSIYWPNELRPKEYKGRHFENEENVYAISIINAVSVSRGYHLYDPAVPAKQVSTSLYR